LFDKEKGWVFDVLVVQSLCSFVKLFFKCEVYFLRIWLQAPATSQFYLASQVAYAQDAVDYT